MRINFRGSTSPAKSTKINPPRKFLRVRYIDFLILLIPTPLASVHFCSSSPIFCSFKKCFSSLFQYFFVITFYVLNNFFMQYKPIRATTGVPRQPYEGSTYCFIHEEAHKNVRFISCDGHQLYERGVDLEVEGVRYIEIHREPVAYVLSLSHNNWSAARFGPGNQFRRAIIGPPAP